MSLGMARRSGSDRSHTDWSVLRLFQSPLYATAPRHWVHVIAVLALLVYAAGWFAMYHGVVSKAEILLELAVIASLPYIVQTRENAGLVVLFALLVGWLLLIDHTVSIAPEGLNVPRFERVQARQFLFIVSGWWLGGRVANARVLLLFGIIGIFAYLALDTTTAQWARVFSGERVDFGLQNAQHTAVYFCSALLALPALAKPAFAFRTPWARGTALVILGLAAAVCLLVLGATQTRQTWIALIPAVVGALIALRLTGGLRLQWPRPQVVAGVLVFVATIVLITPWSGAWQRTKAESERVESLIETDKPARESSITTRLLQWQLALDRIAERPFTGYGGGGVGVLLQQSDLPDFARKGYGHVHNSYLDTTLQYGLVGLALWGCAMLILIRRVIGAVRAGKLDRGFTVFAFAWLAYFFTVNLFESYTRFDSSTYVMFVFAGALYGATLAMPGGARQQE